MGRISISHAPDPKVALTLEEQLEHAKKEASSAKLFALIAIIISSLSLIPDRYKFITNSDEKKIEHISKYIVESELQQTTQLQQTNVFLKHI